MAIQYINEALCRKKNGQLWMFHCNYCGSEHITQTGFNVHMTKKHPLLKPKNKKP